MPEKPTAEEAEAPTAADGEAEAPTAAEVPTPFVKPAAGAAKEAPPSEAQEEAVAEEGAEAVADAKDGGAVNEAAQPAKPEEAGEAQVADRGCMGALQCPSGHQMQRFGTTLPSICSSCNKEQGEGIDMWGCRACDYDVCTECTDAKVAAAKEVPEFECRGSDQAELSEQAYSDLSGELEGLEGAAGDVAAWVWWAGGLDCWGWWWPASAWWATMEAGDASDAEALPVFDSRLPQLVGDETLPGPDGELYEVFYPPDGPPEDLEPMLPEVDAKLNAKADTKTISFLKPSAALSEKCEGGEGEVLAGSQQARRRTSAEDAIADIVTFMSCAAVARYPARVELFELVQAATADALGDHFGRFALVGSTALLIDTPDSDLDAVAFTRSVVDRSGVERAPPGPAQALRWIATALLRHDCTLQMQLVDSARVPVLTVLTADGALSLDLTIDEPLGLSHVRWFQSQRSQPVTESPLPCQWCQLPVPSPDGWEHGLEAAVLRCVKWWLRRRRIPVTREGGYPTVVWTLMVLHVLRCSLFVNDGADSGNQVRTLLAAIAAFFDRLVEGSLRGTLLFGGCGGAEFRPQPATCESAGGMFLGPSLADLSVLDPTTTGEDSASWGVVPSELAPRMSTATELLHTYELRRAQRLSAASLQVGGGAGASALCALFKETGDSLNICPASVPSKTTGMLVLSEGRLFFGTYHRVHPKPGWSAPFLHRRDESSRIALRSFDIDAATGAVVPGTGEEALRWFRPCDFVCMAPLRRRDATATPVASATATAGAAAQTTGSVAGRAADASSLELEAEGLERWREMRVLLGEEPLGCTGPASSAPSSRGQNGRRRTARRQRNARSERA